MKTLLSILLLAATATAVAQTETPQLSTSDQIAIKTCEQQKQAAVQQFNGATQSEQAIIHEWEAAHQGFTIDPQTFAVTKTPPPAKPTPATKK